jgi:endonuclease/exonuclease/phosphatase family metal-dependent hydrolase
MAKKADGTPLCNNSRGGNDCAAMSMNGTSDRPYAESGDALISSTPIYKMGRTLYAWYPRSAFSDEGQPLYPEWGKHRHGLMAGKINVNGNLLWIVNTHLDATDNSDPGSAMWTRVSPYVAERQVWQLLGFIAGLDPDVPVLLVGDFNIYREGYSHGVINSDHQAVWERASTILKQAGFLELGAFSGACESASAANLCSFKATTNLGGAKYSRIDYAFLLDPKSRVDAPRSVVTLKLPAVDLHCVVTDHMAVSVDLQFK